MLSDLFFSTLSSHLSVSGLQFYWWEILWKFIKFSTSLQPALYHLCCTVRSRKKKKKNDFYSKNYKLPQFAFELAEQIRSASCSSVLWSCLFLYKHCQESKLALITYSPSALVCMRIRSLCSHTFELMLLTYEG